MSTIKQDDGYGHSLTLCDTDGYRTCTFGDAEGTTARIREMSNFKCRPDDVLVCAPAKSAEYNSWFDYVIEWEEEMTRHSNLPILLIYYEDLKKNCLQEVNKIGRILGVENKDGLFEAISDKCQFHNMVKDKQKYLAPDVAFLEKTGFSFHRKGVIGDWRNWFTVAQNELFDQVYNEKMKLSNHMFKYS